MAFTFRATAKCSKCGKEHTGKSKLDQASAKLSARAKADRCKDKDIRKGDETFYHETKCPKCKKKWTGTGTSARNAKTNATSKANRCARSH